MRGASRPNLWLVLLAAIAVVVGACGSGQEAGAGEDGGLVATTLGAAGGPMTTAAPPRCEPAPLDARAATVIFVGIGDGARIDDPLVAEVAALGVGGVTLRPPNIEDADQVRALIEGLRARSPRPLLVGVDEEGGRVSRLRGILGSSPSPRRLGQRPPEEITNHAAERGEGASELGFDVVFAPVVDADGGPAGGPIGDRSFAADPAEAGARANAFAAGLHRAGIVAVAKHFPGQGGFDEDSHLGSIVSDVAIEEVEAAAAGFQPLIDAGIPAVMVSHATFTALGPLPASVEPAAYSLLRSMGFDGVAMTDSLGMGAIVQRWSIPEASVMALAAGADMVLANQGDQATAMHREIVAAVADGRLPESRLDEAVARVLELRGDDPATMVCH